MGRPALDAPLATIVLLASLGVGAAALPAAAADCTYTFPRTGGLYPETVRDGDVLCGGPGPDHVLRMEGGTFLGRGDSDRVRRLDGGTFTSGRGRDHVLAIRGGTFVAGPSSDRAWRVVGGAFVGGNGRDAVVDMLGGLFEGGLDDDLVVSLHDGLFEGGDGDDEITVCIDAPPAAHLDVEHVADTSCASILPTLGTPVRSPADGPDG